MIENYVIIYQYISVGKWKTKLQPFSIFTRAPGAIIDDT